MRGRRVGHIPGGTCRVVEGDAVLRDGRPVALLEYGVQCLPRTLQNARSGPSRCTGTLRVYLIKILPESGHPWQNRRDWQNYRPRIGYVYRERRVRETSRDTF